MVIDGNSFTKDIIIYLFIMAGIVFIILRGASEQGYHWQWYRIPKYLFTLEDGTFTAGPLLEGLKITLHITWISMILTYLIGLATALVGAPEPPVDTPWYESRAYTGECSSADGANVLQIEELPGAPALNVALIAAPMEWPSTVAPSRPSRRARWRSSITPSQLSCAA